MNITQLIIFFILNLTCAIESYRHFSDLFERTVFRRQRKDLKSKVCYDFVGCFAVSSQRLSLKHPPDHPSVIQTKFLLYTRENQKTNVTPEFLYYDDQSKSLYQSTFNHSKNLKVIIHGFKGSGVNKGAIIGAYSLLDLEDTNVVILDWTKGAGNSYQNAVANTELVGRQLGLILLDTINRGLKPKDIHLIGFSLGAHVAGCASEVLKSRKYLLGRITGLDPASPLFRNNVLRERSRKLDISDAQLVDIIHTDGSDGFTDGFGLLKPMGHIDFFPNGGREQPGCKDIKNSIVYSHFHEDILDINIACSHVRSWELFVESIHTQLKECKLKAWQCPQGSESFTRGTCFPTEKTQLTSEIGYAANRAANHGIYYLVTRPQSPFCGDPLRAAVVTSSNTPRTAGILSILIEYSNTSTNFEIPLNIVERIERPLIFFNIAAAEFNKITKNTTIISGKVWYQCSEEKDDTSNPILRSPTLTIDKLFIDDLQKNRWEYGKTLTIGKDEKHIKFHLK